MTNEEMFAEFYKRHGQPIRVENLHPNLSKGLTEQFRLYRQISNQVHFCFLDNANFNAVATIYEDKELVGFYLGVVIIIARYFYSLMAHPEVFPQIGDPSRERTDDYPFEYLRHPVENPIQECYPIDPVRLHAAQRLSLCAYLILLFHELGHIELCHLQLLREEFGVTEHSEIAAKPYTERRSSLLRVLEWDADKTAVLSSLAIWKSMISSNDFDYSPLAPLEPESSWSAAATMLFWIMDILQPPCHGQADATHPSPSARLVYVSLFSKEFGGGITEDQFEEGSTHVTRWIFQNKLSTGKGMDADSIKAECASLVAGYRLIANRLVHFQDERALKTGRPVIRKLL